MAKIEDEVKDNQTEEKSDSGSPAVRFLSIIILLLVLDPVVIDIFFNQ